MVDRSFVARMQGYSLTTAEILYHLPDHPAILQTYVWQDYDMAPRFPRLRHFLDFWCENLDGALYKVSVAHRRLVRPKDFHYIDGELKLH